MIMHSVSGGFRAPLPPVLSLVTGKTSYNDFNSRAILNRWTDEPQRLWDGIYELLSLGVEVIIHVGPDPNLLPATFKRLSDNVLAELSGRSLRKFGMRAVSNIISRPWIAKLLFHRAALLAPPTSYISTLKTGCSSKRFARSATTVAESVIIPVVALSPRAAFARGELREIPRNSREFRYDCIANGVVRAAAPNGRLQRQAVLDYLEA